MAATKLQGRGPPAGNIELYSGTYFGACALGGVIGQLGAFRDTRPMPLPEIAECMADMSHQLVGLHTLQ